MARKAWFFHEGGMLALGGAIECETCENPIKTSVNQEWSTGPIRYSGADHEEWESLDSGTREVTGPIRVEANHAGYLIFSPKHLSLQNQIQKGSWKKLAATLSDEEISGKVTSITLEHGSHLEKGDYAYEVFPALTGPKLLEKLRHPDFEILENSYYRQAAWFPDEKLLHSAFYWAGKVATRSEPVTEIEVDSPCVVQLREANGKPSLRVRAVYDQPIEITYRWRGGKPVTTTVKHPARDP
jgi:chondroitin AC lyase